MPPNYNDDFEVNEINQGVLHVTRIHDIIERVEYLHSSGYINGMPTIKLELDELRNWFAEVYALLKPEQKQKGITDFLDYFDNYPIVASSDGYYVPSLTEAKMFKFRLWLFDMMYEHNILTKKGPGAMHVRY